MKTYEMLNEAGRVIREIELPEDGADISDSYHTFGELYDHRRVLTAVLAATVADDSRRAGVPSASWRSKAHHPDDSPMFEGGYFIVGIELDSGPITYHYELTHWDDFAAVPELEHAPKWDGATPADTVTRLKAVADIFAQAKEHGWPGAKSDKSVYGVSGEGWPDGPRTCFNPNDHGPHVWWDHKAPEGESGRWECPGKHTDNTPKSHYGAMCPGDYRCRPEAPCEADSHWWSDAARVHHSADDVVDVPGPHGPACERLHGVDHTHSADSGATPDAELDLRTCCSTLKTHAHGDWCRNAHRSAEGATCEHGFRSVDNDWVQHATRHHGPVSGAPASIHHYDDPEA